MSIKSNTRSSIIKKPLSINSLHYLTNRSINSKFIDKTKNLINGIYYKFDNSEDLRKLFIKEDTDIILYRIIGTNNIIKYVDLKYNDVSNNSGRDFYFDDNNNFIQSTFELLGKNTYNGNNRKIDILIDNGLKYLFADKSKKILIFIEPDFYNSIIIKNINPISISESSGGKKKTIKKSVKPKEPVKKSVKPKEPVKKSVKSVEPKKKVLKNISKK